MQRRRIVLLASLGLALAASPATGANRNFYFQAGDITGEGGKVDKKSGHQWVPIISWEWRRFVKDDGSPKTDAKLKKQGFYDTGSILVNGQFDGCLPGKAISEAVLKTPGMRYTLSNLVVVQCNDSNMLLNYAAIRPSSSW